MPTQLPKAIQALFPGEIETTRTEFFKRPNATQFDFSDPAKAGLNAWVCSELSLLAYAESQTYVEKAITAAGLKFAATIADAYLSGFVARTPDGSTAFFVFRGTVLPLPATLTPDFGAAFDFGVNLIRDFLVFPVFPQPALPRAGLVHAGFQDGFRRLENQIKEQLRRLAVPPLTNLVFTGHSLGGALATLAAASLDNPAGVRRSLITFGAPPAGTPAFAGAADAAIDGEHHRYVLGADIVGNLQADTLASLIPFFGYAQHAHQVRLTCPGVRTANGAGYVLKLIQSQVYIDPAEHDESLQWLRSIPDGALNHAPILYAASCLARLPAP